MRLSKKYSGNKEKQTPLKQAGNTRQGAMQEHDTALNTFSKALT